MASHSTLRPFLPAAHGFSAVPVAALKAAATSSASFVVVCPAGRRSADVAAALQAATNGSGLIFSSRMVARAAKRSGGVEDGRTGEDSEEVGAGDDGTANLFFVGAFDDLPGGGGEDIKAENVVGEDIKVENVGGGGEDINAENVGGDYTVNTKAKDEDTKAKDEDTKAKDDVGFAYGEVRVPSSLRVPGWQSHGALGLGVLGWPPASGATSTGHTWCRVGPSGHVVTS
jgi:rhodanese-related sulfurtransferase